MTGNNAKNKERKEDDEEESWDIITYQIKQKIVEKPTRITVENQKMLLEMLEKLKEFHLQELTKVKMDQRDIIKEEIQNIYKEEIKELRTSIIETTKEGIKEVMEEKGKLKEEILEEVRKEMKDCIKEIFQENLGKQKQVTTYANAVQNKVNIEIPKNPSEISQNHVFTIYPEKGKEFKDSTEVKETLKKIINPTKEKIQIQNMKTVKGNGILVELRKKEDLNRILENKKIEGKLTEIGLKLGEPKKYKPKIIVYNMDENLEEEKIFQGIYEQNQIREICTEEDFKNDCTLAFKTGRRDREEKHWVLNVTPEIREKLVNKERIYIEWNSHKVEDFLSVTRCYKCQGYAHIAKYCTAKKETCSHCGEEGHNRKECENLDREERCGNCKKYGKPAEHAVSWKECPVYLNAKGRIMRKTNYIPKNLEI